MVNPNPGFLTKRVKRRSQSGITSDRYEFLGLDQAEPDLGDPLVGPSSIGDNPYTGSIYDAYVLIADNTGSGNRYWTNQSNLVVGSALQPGSITVRDTGSVVGSVNAITDINFIGTGVTVTSPASWIGAGSSSVDIDISITDVKVPTGQTGSIGYRDSNSNLQGATGLFYNSSNQRVGVGSTLPTQKLDVDGNAIISGNLTISNILISSSSITATSGTITYYGDGSNLTNLSAGEADKLINARNFSISGDVNAPAVSFDGTGNVTLNATIQPNSVEMGTDTFGEYVQSVSGTAGEIEVTNGTGESSTPQIGLPNSLSITNSLYVPGITTIGNFEINSGIITAVSGVVTYYGDGSELTGIQASIAGVATALQDARNFSITGDVSAPAVSFDGTSDVTLNATIQPNSVSLGSDTTGDYVESITNGDYITGGDGGSEGSELTLSVDATSENTPSKVVARDSSGNFSAGTITATTFSGTATTATTLETSRTFQLSGDVFSSAVSFDGSSNVTLNATINPNSVELSTDTTGDYVESITGTAGEIEVSNGTGEGSTPQIGLPANVSISNNLNVSGISTLGTLEVSSGIVTASSGVVTYYGDGSNLTGIEVGEASSLKFARTFEISGDILANPVSFDGTANVNLNATIQPNSVDLSTDTTGDYVESITGTAGEIEVSNGTGEGSTPQIGLPNNVTIANDLTVVGDITIGQVEISSNLIQATSGVVTYYGDGSNLTGISIGLGTNTSGDYVESITGTAGEIEVSNGTGEGSTPQIGLPNNVTITNLNVSGITTLGEVKISSGIVTASSGVVTYYGDGQYLTGIPVAEEATALQNPRTFEITGDVIASPISFDGTSNVSLAATIQPNSVSLGSDTTGDYVESITGTAGEIEVSNGTGEGSTPQIGLPENVTITGIITATTFSGSGASLTSIPNGALDNSTVSYGGVQLSLGGSDATPAFDLQDATNYPYSSLTGISTSIVGDTSPQLGGNLDLNSNDITGTGDFNVTGIITATTFSGNLDLDSNDITGTGDFNVTGIITATTFSGSGASLTNIPNGALDNSTISYGGVQLSLGGSDATPAFDLQDATNYPYSSLTGITTDIVGDTSPQLGGNLDLNSNDITGTGDFNITGIITATTFSGSGASLTSIPNGALDNSTVSYGGVQLSLGGSDATPAFDLQDATGLPVSTGISGLAANVATFLATPSSSNLSAVITDETGSGSLVFATSPTLVTPTLGDANASSLNISGITTLGEVKISSGIVTAVSGVVTYYGDGSNLTGVSGGGGSGTFDTGITTSIYVNVDGGVGINTAETNDIFVGPGIAYSFPSTSGVKYVIESIHITNVFTDELYFSGRHDFNGGEDVPIAQRLVIPYQGSTEFLDQPIIANPSDILRFQALSGAESTATGIDGGIDAFIVYSTKEDTDYIGAGKTVSSSTDVEVFKATSNPAVLQSIKLCNYSLNNDIDASVSIYRDGIGGNRLGHLVYNLTIPKNSVIEILEKPKYLALNDAIASRCTGDGVSVTVSGKYIA